MRCMDTLVIIISLIIMCVGLIGTIAPVLPGLPLVYAGMLIAYLGSPALEIPLLALTVWGIIMVVTVIVDQLIPVYMTRRYGGSLAGQIGAIAGLILGSLLLTPVGALLGMLLGAGVGELIHEPLHPAQAVRSAWGTFLGFVITSGIKITVSLMMIIYLITRIYSSMMG